MHQARLEFVGDAAEAASVLTLDYLPGAADEMRFTSGGKMVVASLGKEGALSGIIDGEPFVAACHLSGSELTLFIDGITRRFRLRNPIAEAMRTPRSSGSILAPMPGRVMLVHVKQHDKVEAHAPLLVLEAMKMEHVLRAPESGVVGEVMVRQGDQVKESDQLLELVAS